MINILIENYNINAGADLKWAVFRSEESIIIKESSDVLSQITFFMEQSKSQFLQLKQI